MVEHFIIIFAVYVSMKSVSFVRCVSGGGMDSSRERKWLNTRERERVSLSTSFCCEAEKEELCLGFCHVEGGLGID